ncbi:MAG TPA: SpoIIE family protein phosphatase [Bacteroidota bacterium]|nr:SpoIIE family protein phosphatase [Bacteroidota bacterium]
MKKLKSLLPFLLLLIIAVPVIVWLYPLADPNGGIRLQTDSEEITELSRSFLDSLRIPHDGLTSAVELRLNKQLIRQTQEELGLEQSNELLRAAIPGYFWEVRWKTAEAVSRESGGGDSRQEAEKMLEMLKGKVLLQLTSAGRIITLDRKIPDSLVLESMTMSEAREYARSVIRRYGAIPQGTDPGQPASERTLGMPGRSDHEFTWNTTYPPLTNSVKLKVLVSGNTITKIETEFNVPTIYSRTPFETGVQIIIVILSAIVIVALVILAFRRFRSFEIGFRVAIMIGIISAVFVGLEVYLSGVEVGWELLFSMIFAPLLIGGALLLIWAVCESVGRETWNDKFISLDLLTRGHFTHSRVGAGVIRGIGVGLGALALWLAMVSATGTMTPVWMSPSNDNALRMFSVPASSLLIVAHNFYAVIYFFALFVLFAVSYLRRYFSSPVVLISISALALGLMRQGSFFPLPAGIILHAVIGAVVIWSFYRYDVLTAFLAMFTIAVAQDAGALWMSGHVTYTSAGIATSVFFGLLIVGSVAAQFRKKEITDFDSIVPVFAKHITERQRLQQELEIARQVQMSFLPKSNPKVRGLDIASRCVPALEVGGDYFDFVLHSPRELGIAIGDVSGKGTQAAFYMTLAKGFLRALSNPTGSVSEVLKQMNKLFYENVERGAFISMVYGIFDMGKKRLRLTRAGHNPVLVWRTKKQKLEVIQPNGLALGLENGKKFSKTIQEVKIPFAKGDCFVFYTDGFTEAMNKKLEEYGDERFAATVQNYAERSAAEMLEGILGDVKIYIGKAKQHDDMTLVVVKIV